VSEHCSRVVGVSYRYDSNQGLEPYRKEPVLDMEPFEYWELKPHRQHYLNWFKNQNLTGIYTSILHFFYISIKLKQATIFLFFKN